MDQKEMAIVTSRELEELLAVSVVSITFLRKDGAERLIHCTTRIPENLYTPKAPSLTKERKPKPGNFIVWDVENNGFRSFNFEQILSVEVGVWK